jgi:membrane protein
MRLSGTLVWRVWDRMLEIEFVDRSVALAGKAFVSFFPLVIVVAAFVPARIRDAIVTALTRRFGLDGQARALASQAFASADDVRRATGLLGLVLTIFFATSFTTAMQRMYLRAWRRPRDLKGGSYVRGITWLLGMLVYPTITGAAARTVGSGAGLILFVPVATVLAIGWWWFTSWYLLLGHVRWRALLPGAVITSLAISAYTATASLWMPRIVSENLDQFGFFGIALALVTWFSGAAICVLVGACAGPVLASDRGVLGRLTRGSSDDVLTPGAPPSLVPPERQSRLRDMFAARANPDEE